MLGFLTSLLLKKQQAFPVRSTTGIAPATRKEGCTEQILLWGLIVIQNVSQHWEKQLRSGSSRYRAVQAATPQLPTA